MAHAARLEPDEHLARLGLGEVDPLDDERRAERLQHCGPNLHAETIERRRPVTSGGRVHAPAPQPGLRPVRDRATALDGRYGVDDDCLSAARACGDALAGEGRSGHVRANHAVRDLRAGGGGRRRPRKTQAADDRRRRCPCARDREPGGRDPPRPARVLADPGRRVRRRNRLRLLRRRRGRSAALGRTRAAAADGRGRAAGTGVDRTPRRAAPRRRALRARPCRAVSHRRRLVRVRDRLAARDADAVPGGARDRRLAAALAGR